MRGVRLVVVALGLAVLPETWALEGQVLDAESGKPLANVTVSVAGRTQTARPTPRAVRPGADPHPPFRVAPLLPGGATSSRCGSRPCPRKARSVGRSSLR